MRRALVAAVAMLAAALACSEPSKPQTAPSKETTAMDDPLRALDRHPAAAISIRYGTEHFGNGQITLTIRGDGAVSVEQRFAGNVATFAAQLEPGRVAELGRALADHHFTRPRTSTLPREPGDTQLVLRLSGPDVPAFEATIWFADRYKDRDLDAILVLVEDVLHTATGGKLGQPKG
jgi:hypothetical protein